MELEEKFMETLQVLKGIVEAARKENNNKKMQGELKELIQSFKEELKKSESPQGELTKEINLSKTQQEDKSIFSSLQMRNPEEAFNNAIGAGLKNPENYMYMHSGEGKDYFKNRETGEYKEFNISKESLSKSPIASRDEFLEQKNPKEAAIIEKLDGLKTKAEKLAKDNGITWAVPKEHQPTHHRDSIKSTLDTLIDNAKVKVSEQNREIQNRQVSKSPKL